MRSWLVGGALIEGPGGVLLVRNRRRDGRTDWSPPGGVIDPGETLLEGLTREVREETGLEVARWAGPIYVIEARAPDLGWSLRVEAHRALAVEGDLVVDDPDGIVVDACWADVGVCDRHLARSPRWVSEPLLDWLREPWEGSRGFGYDVAGSDLRSLVVTRR